jgi:hypothetical protein
VATVVWLCCASPTQAVLFQATGDPSYNTTAPTGSLTNSGWQFQGLWDSFLGTPIGPHHFITAKHLGVPPATVFVLNGVRYLPTASFEDPDADLRIYRVCGTFPAFAPLYTNRDELGKSLVVFGRGTQRGAPVTSTNSFGVKTNGWLWGSYDGAVRWGENTVTGIEDAGLDGGQLKAEFNADGGINECDLSWGDSGGAVFLQEGTTWRLAGINYSVDGYFNYTNTDTGRFDAAIFDQGGLYQGEGTNWVGMPDLPHPQPGAFYATRISPRLDWVNTVLSMPLPDEERLALLSANRVEGPYQDDPLATIDEAARRITLAQPTEPRFFRLRSCQALTLRSIQTQSGLLILTYE